MYQLGSGKSLKSVGAECLACRVFAEPDVVVTLVGNFTCNIRSAWASPEEACGPGQSFVFRRELCDDVILCCTNPDMILPHTQFLCSVNTDARASDENDIVGTRDSSRLLRCGSNQTRTVGVPNGGHVGVVVHVGCGNPVHEAVVGGGAALGVGCGHHIERLRSIIPKPYDRG
ncbi:apurinic endonuclease Apn1 [Streptomyces sp. KO7888]|nr:apurinic endonuclease Apn1 [Streptomyces sp. KO7888]